MAGAVDSTLRRADGLARAGQRGEAAALYLRLLDRFPGNRRARAGLDAVARVSGPTEAAAARDEIATVTGLLSLGELEAAQRCAEALVLRSPHLADFHTLLAQTLVAAGAAEAALPHLETAHRLTPDNPDAICNLARHLIALNRPSEAVTLLAPLCTAAAASSLALQLYGRALAMIGLCQPAVEALDRLIARDPGNAQAHGDRAIALFAEGRTAEGGAAISHALALDPERAGFRYLHCIEQKLPPDDPVVLEIAAALAAPALPRPDRVLLGFALAKQRHDHGDSAAAFRLWAEANAAQKAELGYDIAQDRTLFGQIRALAEAGLPLVRAPALRTRRPVFVIGLPRSGTTLVEQILASHPAVYGAGERDALPRAINLASAGAERLEPKAALAIRAVYLDAMAATTPPAAVIVDKMPSNYLHVGHIAAALPEAAIVHVHRDPRATCWSNFRHLFPQGGARTGFGHDLGDLAEYHGLYRGLMAFWEALLPGRVLHLSYEALCDDQRGQTERLLAHAGLPWHEGCMRFHETERAVTSTSSDQVRRPLYRGSSEEWRRYEPWLGPLLDGLGRPDPA